MLYYLQIQTLPPWRKMGAKTTRELMKTLTKLGLSVALSGQIDMFFMYPQEKKKNHTFYWCQNGPWDWQNQRWVGKELLHGPWVIRNATETDISGILNWICNFNMALSFSICTDICMFYYAWWGMKPKLSRLSQRHTWRKFQDVWLSLHGVGEYASLINVIWKSTGTPLKGWPNY